MEVFFVKYDVTNIVGFIPQNDPYFEILCTIIFLIFNGSGSNNIYRLLNYVVYDFSRQGIYFFTHSS